ncbi:MAG: hypothetical protein H7246_05815 [Phycisphaerae bacterium]|nr:hypothetical protein [Saprospiraceae bacterium]
MENNLDDLITDYLSNTLDSEARFAFEQRLAAEPELAARVAFERDISAALNASSPENKLRANLRQLSEKYDAPESLDPSLGEAPGGKAQRWWILAAGVLLLGGLAYWNLRPQEKPTMSLPPQPPLESPSTPPAEELPKNGDEKNKPDSKTQPIAAAFKPIPKLESYIGSQTRSGDFHFRVDQPKSGATMTLQTGQVNFRLSGKIEGATPSSQSIQVMIFSNNQQNFENSRPVESQMLESKPDGAFLLQKKLALSPGLYYLVFEDRQSGEWLFVDKFLVKV